MTPSPGIEPGPHWWKASDLPLHQPCSPKTKAQTKAQIPDWRQTTREVILYQALFFFLPFSPPPTLARAPRNIPEYFPPHPPRESWLEGFRKMAAAEARCVQKIVDVSSFVPNLVNHLSKRCPHVKFIDVPAECSEGRRCDQMI